LGKVGVGLDISTDYIEMAKARLEAPSLFHSGAPEYYIYQGDARCLLDFVKPKSIDMCITSPPYWDILSQKRTADSKDIRNYGSLEEDLGRIGDYSEFIEALGRVFEHVLVALRPTAYCAVVVMDLRKKDLFYPFHSDLASRMQKAGFVFDDTIIWDRGQEYNNLRPLGFPSVFRVNKIHEFILIFRKPAG
jgi:DNA modification methylase